MNICKVKNCDKRYYAKGYCRKHYVALIERKDYKLHKCKIKECSHHTHRIYCYIHEYRMLHKLPIDFIGNCNILRTKEKNNMWKGGIAGYPNHSLMKKNRLIILLHNPRCEICRKSATEIHHKDFSKSNHKLSNLQAVCHKCNIRLSSEFYQRYGMTLTEITSKLGRSIGYWWKHQKELDKVLLDKEIGCGKL